MGRKRTFTTTKKLKTISNIAVPMTPENVSASAPTMLDDY
ncbi:Unknown protein sequence [Pseudomonas coronafaciens pv. oryzae]|nr:Unknown protein sequence [Pseudomonas coronafaciens pv. oryzae]